MTNYRYYIIAGLLVLASMFLFAVPQENLSGAMWTFVLVGTKAIAFALYCGADALSQYWTRRNEMKSFDEIFKED